MRASGARALGFIALLEPVKTPIELWIPAPSMFTSFTSLLVCAAVLACSVFFSRFGQREWKLLPGPPTIPFLGNLHILPTDGGEWPLKFMEWSRQHGDIMSIKLVSETMIILSSPTAIKEVVDKHGWATSSRPPHYLAGLAVGGYHLLLASDSARLRNIRKTITRFFSPQNSAKRLPVQAAESTQLLFELMAHPESFSESIRRYTPSIAMITVYGHRASALTSRRFFKMLAQFLHILLPGAYPPIDLLPPLRYLPERWAPWFAVCRRNKSEMAAFHLEAEKRSVAKIRRSNIAEESESYMKCIQHMDLSQEEYPAFSLMLHSHTRVDCRHFVYRYTALPIVEASSDTSAAFLLSLVLILGLYLEYQERARQEIEFVVGTTRIPELEDFKKMPFLDALIKEVIRIRPAFPIGIPHRITKEIRYKNYIVPKNATVILNIYSIFHNPEIFEDPEDFNPDRFLHSEHGTRPGMDTDFRDNFSFGGGRRICPGQHVARTTMRLTAMRLIWAFKFGPPVAAETGLPITRELDCYAPEFVVMPHPFKCAIQLRGAEHRDMIIQAFKDVKSLLSRYEYE
ncbi:cytochrome P450 [Mycena rosella]|uniref:Cytochrome P450 n=1 Tax=Mycena rosella TaxID=1033263 RepID=A0AAD7G506_MYCRO|nr:cytochrome P450 [Mycena rosella]